MIPVLLFLSPQMRKLGGNFTHVSHWGWQERADDVDWSKLGSLRGKICVFQNVKLFQTLLRPIRFNCLFFLQWVQLMSQTMVNHRKKLELVKSPADLGRREIFWSGQTWESTRELLNNAADCWAGLAGVRRVCKHCQLGLLHSLYRRMCKYLLLVLDWFQYKFLQCIRLIIINVQNQECKKSQMFQTPPVLIL